MNHSNPLQNVSLDIYRNWLNKHDRYICYYDNLLHYESNMIRFFMHNRMF